MIGTETDLQYIMDGTGNYYKVNIDNQLVVAKDREEATVFEYQDASQRIEGKKSKFYHLFPIKEGVEKVMYSNVVSIHSENILREDPDEYSVLNEYDMDRINWLEYLNHFCFLTGSMSKHKEKLNEELSVIDKKICDLLHWVELYDLTEDEGIEATEQLKEARVQRRDVKDEMLIAEMVQSNLVNSANAAKARKCIKEIQKMERRVYQPRELTELFKGMQGRKTDRKKYKEIQKMNNMAIQNGVIEPEEVMTEQTVEYHWQETIFDGQQNDWLAMIRQQLEFYENVEQYLVNVEIEIDEIGCSIEDILVKIEDANYNAVQGYQVFKELKELRNMQKEKLQERDALQAIVDCFDCTAMAENYRYLVETLEGR